jgi:hypothetical protein
MQKERRRIAEQERARRRSGGSRTKLTEDYLEEEDDLDANFGDIHKRKYRKDDESEREKKIADAKRMRMTDWVSEDCTWTSNMRICFFNPSPCITIVQSDEEEEAEASSDQSDDEDDDVGNGDNAPVVEDAPEDEGDAPARSSSRKRVIASDDEDE